MVTWSTHLYAMGHCPRSMLVLGAHVFGCPRLLACCWRVRSKERVPFAPLALQLVSLTCGVGGTECARAQIGVLLVDACLLDRVSVGGGMHVLGLEAGHDSRRLLGLVTSYGRLQLRCVVNGQSVQTSVCIVSIRVGANTTIMQAASLKR